MLRRRFSARTLNALLSTAVVIALMPANVTFGQSHATSADVLGGERKGLTEIRGEILCSACTVAEAKQATDETSNLYLLDRGEQQAVMQVTAVGDTATGRTGVIDARWETIVGLTNELHVRVEDQLWQQLTATQNLRKPVTIKGILHSTRTFDITGVTTEN
ncbi:MAG: hypothetical protein AB7G75_07895 [Candidatus Binatia bacterium]